MEMNKVMLVGNLGRDPEVKYLPSGDPVAEFSIGVSRSYKDRNGERRDETAWVNISWFRKTAEFCGNYLKKGTAIYVEGRLRYSTWETPEGQKRNKLDVLADRIQFAYPRSVTEGSGGGGGGNRNYSDGPPQDNAPASSGSAAPPSQGPGPDTETKDDLPF